MPGDVKAPLRPFEYMAWAKTVPTGARYDLTASGMRDTAAGPDPQDAAWAGTLPLTDLTSREAAAAASRAFVERVAARYDVDPACVVPTLGASLAITHAMIALVRAGDHVVVERPTYEALHRVPEILGARVSRLERKFDESWAVVPERLAQLLSPRTRAVILTNLHNPSGVALETKTLRVVAELSARVGAMVLVDEVYLDYAFDTAADAAVGPACKAAPNCVSWSSTTKAFGFGALRAAWIVTPDREIARALTLATEYLFVHAPASSTSLGRRVLEHADVLQERARQRAEHGRAIVERWLAGERRVSWIPPAAGLTGLVRLPEFVNDGTFADHLRERYDTQVAPGAMFEAPGYVRVSFGGPTSDLETGLANFSSALDDL